ncbi:transporter substrate-binding domain-containing protein [Variovorax sp. J22R133]|uniref:transporter substrate-binding domain-containing protein n=1 Tax=Variovorax brevis TaxID=3053503 RepID=UPI00257609D9|nr:transporter substrate-binding domain-containing protein [Variovorax sp. J22R133]MDM0112707.1 transporter substrate-binding domain-containing protein [Variovorax sp. J22R133]
MTHPSISPAVVAAFCPTGKLRASINLGNPILANRDPATGEPVGISIDLARAFGERLGVETEWLVFDKAVQSVTAVRNEQADIGFFAIDPARSEGLRFTAPYVLIEGSYLVPQPSALQDNEAVDHAGVRIGVASGSAYDLFLTREIKSAAIERLLKAEDVVEALLGGRVEVAAGIRQMLESVAAGSQGALRLLPGRFMVIQQAMGTPASRGDEAAALLSSFVEEMKASGFVADSMKRHGIQGATVAPAGAVA